MILKSLMCLLVVVGICLVQGSSALAFTDFASKAVPAIVKDQNKTNPMFTTNGGTVECKTASSTGKITVAKSTTTKETEEYSGCKAFNLEAKATPGEFEFHANGTVAILNKITVTVPEDECTVKFGPELNEKITGVTYANLETGGHKAVEISLNSTNITYVTSSESCGLKGKNGEYKGSFLAEGFLESTMARLDIEMI